ncbi:MAG: hypothetical protein QOE70_6724 [Chthoniobacter sp.]|jgi:hypothetical protein|nr:hypothetical protein [Chthoniobacter sp.]
MKNPRGPGLTPEHSRQSRRSDCGSTLIIALTTITVLAVLASTMLAYVGSRLDTAFQATRWQQALSTAEGGVQQTIAALNLEATLRESGLDTAAAWTGWQRNLTATVGAKTYTYNQLVSTDADTPERRTIVQVDQIGDSVTTGGRHWYRVRSVGTVTLPGNSRISSDVSDVRLRKVGIQSDWARTRLFGAALAALGPRQVSRVVEAILEPQSPFQYALFARNQISYGHMTLDSYDSSDTTTVSRQTPGSDGSKGQMANIGTNATTGTAITSLPLGHVYGSATTNGASVQSWQTQVSWEYRKDIYVNLPSVTAPFTTYNQSASPAVATTVNVPASANSWATAWKVDYTGAMNPTAAKKVTINNAGGNYVIFYVHGNMGVSNGNNVLVIPNGVKAKFYVDGNIAVGGSSVSLPSKKPGDFIIYGLPPSAGAAAPRGKKAAAAATVRTVSMDEQIAAIYAPDHDASAKANNDTMIGSLVARNITIKANPHTQWKFDEALLKEGGDISFKITHWMEDAWFADAWATTGNAYRPSN